MPNKSKSKTANRDHKKRIAAAYVFADNVIALKDQRTFLANYWMENEARNSQIPSKMSNKPQAMKKTTRLTMINRNSRALFAIDNGHTVIINNDTGYSVMIDARICTFESLQLGEIDDIKS